MLDFRVYGKLPLIGNIFFLIREDGHIFTFDYDTFKWSDVTGEITFDGTWELYDTSQQFDHAMVDAYEEISKRYNEEELEYQKKHPSFKWGNALNFYKKNGQLRAKDENGNEYELKIPYMLASEEKLIDDSWKRFYRLDVLFEVGKFREIIRIYRLDLYKDKEGNLRAFSKDGKEYRVSKKTGYVNEVLDTKGVIDSYTPVSENFLVRFCDVERPEFFITWFDLENMRELDKYLLKNKKSLKEKHDIELGDDIRYYNSGWGNIYAVDSNKNEFNVLPKGLVPVDKKTVKTHEWEEINHLNALEYARFYQKRHKELKSKDAEILAVDLKIYQNDNDDFIGQAEDGKWYLLNDDGDFEIITQKMVRMGLDMTKNDAPKYGAVLHQGWAIAHSYLESYINFCYSKFSEEEKKQFNVDEIGLYTNKNKKEKIKLYIRDGNKNEYLCSEEGLLKVPTGTIKKNCKKIPGNQFKMYYQVFLMEEENPDLFGDD